MSAGGHDAGREIARGLSQILNQALAPGAPRRALEAARDLAQVLSLRGLDRLLGVLAAQPERPWPPALRPAIDRLLGAAAECARDGSVAAFRRADDEMSLTAQAIESIAPPHASSGAVAGAGEAASRMGAAARVTPVALAEVLSGLNVQGDAAFLRQTRLLPLVAAALRAALDWLTDDGGTRRPLIVEFDGSALEVTCDGVTFSGIQPAGEVLAGVGAHLGPSGARPGTWSVRVPVFADRETFLMIEQDELCLAVPWHAVARVRLLPADAIEEMARRQGLQVLPSLAHDPRRAAEQPVVIVALGRKRACLVADRLVWRMAADPAPAPGSAPAPGITRAVRADDEEIYWVLEPSWLLRGIAAPPLPESPRRGPATAPRPASGSAPAPAGRPDVSAETTAETKAAPQTTAAPDIAPRAPVAPPPIPFRRASHGPLRELRSEDVDPIESRTSPAPPKAVGPASYEPVSGAEPTAAPAPARRRAVIAEDSITARVFLMRLLEQQGFEVHAVTRAAELRAALTKGPWSMVFIDVDLPDALGAQLLAEVSGQLGGSTALVALARDAADEALARTAGVSLSLRKPFEREALERLLTRLSRAGTPPEAGGSGPRT